MFSESPIPFACVTSAELPDDDANREWQLAQRCLKRAVLDEAVAGDGLADEDCGSGSSSQALEIAGNGADNVGMHLMPALLQVHLEAVRQLAVAQGGSDVEGARRGPLVGVRMDTKYVYGGQMKVKSRA